MQRADEYIGLPDGVHRANGLLSRWELYSLAMRNEIESRRRGRCWEVRVDSLDQYIKQLRAV